MTTHEERLAKARLSLEGLSVGDAFGAHFEFESVDWERPKRAFKKRDLPPPVWRYTDDTLMACSIYAILRRHETIDPDKLAQSFTQHFDIDRGYGTGAEKLLSDMQTGDWATLASAMFDGTGSFGNGSAMRVAPIGPYFSDNIQDVVRYAQQSSIVTHTHLEGIAGAIAVAVASAIACQLTHKPSIKELLDTIIPHVPSSQVKRKLYHALTLSQNISTQEVAKQLGCGWDVSAMDTVPFALWIAAKYLDDFEEALWQTISVGGDADTTGAMVGGIVACYVGQEGIPQKWIEQREKLPDWAFED